MLLIISIFHAFKQNLLFHTFKYRQKALLNYISKRNLSLEDFKETCTKHIFPSVHNQEVLTAGNKPQLFIRTKKEFINFCYGFSN